MSTPVIEIEDLTFAYPNGPLFNFGRAEIAPGQIVVMVGTSGAGKSTLMRLLRGELEPKSGAVRVLGKPVETRKNRLVLDESKAGWVPQLDDLQPMLNGRENMGHHILRLDPEEKERRLDELVRAFRLQGVAQRRVSELSGGQRQRVSIAKAMAGSPPVLLMDESLAQLDLRTKTAVLLDLKELVRTEGVGVLLVLHDPADAMMIADQIWVMHNGALVQKGTVHEVVAEPFCYEVAGLFRHVNVVPVELQLPGPWRVQGTEKWCYAAELELGQWVDSSVEALHTPEGVLNLVRFEGQLLLCGK